MGGILGVFPFAFIFPSCLPFRGFGPHQCSPQKISRAAIGLLQLQETGGRRQAGRVCCERKGHVGVLSRVVYTIIWYNTVVGFLFLFLFFLCSFFVCFCCSFDGVLFFFVFLLVVSYISLFLFSCVFCGCAFRCVGAQFFFV